MTILFIGGSGRSGSTLLEMVLGNCPSYFSIGEARYFWEYIEQPEILCGCGDVLYKCHFWSQVIEILIRNNHIDFKRMARLSRQLNRSRRIVEMTLKSQAGKTADWDELVRGTEALYHAIYDVVGWQKVIVDTSKVPSHLAILCKVPGLDIRLLHLVRDGRAVAYAWSKRIKRELAVQKEGVHMPQRSALRAMLTWVFENSAIVKMAPTLSATVMRYEDFVTMPYDNLYKKLEDLALSNIGLELLKQREIVLEATHSIGGNPLRFTQKPIVIQANEEWQDNMPMMTKASLGIIGLPLLSQFQYKLLSCGKQVIGQSGR